jgi:hypothetical protein
LIVEPKLQLCATSLHKMTYHNAFIAAAGLNSSGLDLAAGRPTGYHIAPAFIALAAVAVVIVGYLIWDFFHQKRVERQQRLRVERFREKRFKEQAVASVPKAGRGQSRG